MQLTQVQTQEKMANLSNIQLKKTQTCLTLGVWGHKLSSEPQHFFLCLAEYKCMYLNIPCQSVTSEQFLLISTELCIALSFRSEHSIISYVSFKSASLAQPTSIAAEQLSVGRACCQARSKKDCWALHLWNHPRETNEQWFRLAATLLF